MFNIRNRVVLVLAALIAVLVFVPGVGAQDTFGLSAEDFALFTGANAASAQFETFDYSFILDMAVEAEGDAFGLDMTGAGLIGDSAFSMKLDGNAEGLGPIDMELRVVDSVVYVNGVDPSLEWVSISESEFTQLSDTFGDQLPINPNDLATSEDPIAALGIDDAAMGDIMGNFMTFDPNAYVTLERLPDEGGNAVFKGDLLLSDLASSELAMSLVAAGISSDENISFEDAQAQAQGVMAMAGPVLVGSEVSLTQYINTGSNMVDRSILRLNFGGGDMPFVVDFTFDITINEYAPANISIETPAGATPLADILSQMGLLAPGA